MYNKVLIKKYDPKRFNVLYKIYSIKAKSRTLLLFTRNNQI